MGLLSSLVKSQSVVSLPPHASVHDAAETMARHRIGSIVILDYEENLLGIFTERDLLNRVIAPSRDPSKISLEEVMTRDVRTISLHESFSACFEHMQDIKGRHLPIVDDQGKVIGMVTMRNLLEWIVKEVEEENVQLRSYISS